MITLDSVTFRYFGTSKNVLEDISLEVVNGEFVGIIGPTGCGKSTLCYLLNGLIPHTLKGDFVGDVFIGNSNTKETKVEELSTFVGYMLQEPSFQIATPFVESEIVFGMENLGILPKEMKERLETIMKVLGIENLRTKATSDLSEGEKQRVILASILVMHPEILVLDECTSMLDVHSKKELRKTLDQLNAKEGKTIIMVEHDLDYLLDLTNRIILLNDGCIVADGPTEEILTNSTLLKANGLEPPRLIQLFETLKEHQVPIKRPPSSYDQAFKLMRSWL